MFSPPWTVARQAPLSMEFSRQEYWSGLPFPSPGVDYLKNSLCGNYKETLEFLGINKDSKMPKETWQKALLIDKEMINDSYIIHNINKLIHKKIDNAKIGKLICNGNYQQLSGDPFALMQHICGLEVTGLLKAKECYTSYWSKHNVNELVVFRSPMIGHNNIRKMTIINNADTQYWYQYMKNVFITNGFDTACMALSGADMDGDSVFSTNNNVLIRCYKELPPINCIQHNAQKQIITEENVVASNMKGFGNNVGSITNRATAMFSVQAGFEKHTKEYKELEYRILCTQKFQQDSIDAIKGITFTPMPKYWYDRKSCGDNEYQRSICCEKKPYFMIYRYDEEYRKYKNFIKEQDSFCMKMYGMTIKELLAIPNDQLTNEQKETIKWYYVFNPVDVHDCTINKICYYIENVIGEYKSTLKERKVNYKSLMTKRRCTKKHKDALALLMNQYIEVFKNIVNNSDSHDDNTNIISTTNNYFKERAQEICHNDDELINILLELCYGDNNIKSNKEFCWMIIVDKILAKRGYYE